MSESHPCGADNAHYVKLAELRSLLEAARALAEQIDIQLTLSIRANIEEALEDIEFLEAIDEATR